MSETSGVALAIDLGGTKLAAAIGDAEGQLRRQRSEPTGRGESAERVLARALQLARGVLEEERAAGVSVARVGVSTMGITGEEGTLLAPNVEGWGRLAIPQALRSAFPGLAIAVANDVRAAALAELRWGALAGVATGVYVNLGTGTAAAIVIGGRLFEGAHAAAGEIGYCLAPGWQDVPLAAEGGVPAEQLYGGNGVARRASERLGTTLDLPGILALAEHDPEAATFVGELWDGIAALTANLAIVIDPEVVVLGGGYVRTDSSLVNHVAALVGRAVPFAPRVVRARFGGDASLHGAVAVALDDSVSVGDRR